jgi:hypothetical protein
MAGSASIVVTATGTLTAGTVENAPINGGGFVAFDRRPQKRRREAWQDELAKLLPVLRTADVVGPEVDDQLIERAPREDPGARQYIESLFASIERAKKDQQRAQLAARLAKAEKEREAAEFMLTQAIEAERQARQDIEEMDIVFIASVLANL